LDLFERRFGDLSLLSQAGVAGYHLKRQLMGLYSRFMVKADAMPSALWELTDFDYRQD
jgi:hypothetical protein